MNRSIKRLSSFITVLVMSLVLSFVAYAQANVTLIIDSISDENFPNVEAVVSVLDSQGLPIRDLTGDNFSISEDKQPVEKLNVELRREHPLELALVIDTSESTGYGENPTPIESITQAAQEFLTSLATKDNGAVISFSDTVSVNQDLTNDKSLIRDALDALAPAGNAALNDALMKAIGLLKGRSERPVIILFTDGKDSGLSQYTIQEVIDEAIRQKVIVYPIAWGGANKEDLGKLADLTRGEMQFLPGNQPDLNTIQAAFNNLIEILPDLRVQYKIVFTSALAADGNDHDLTVKVDHLGQQAEQSRRFNAVPREVTISLPNFQDGQEVGSLVRFVPEVKAPAPVKQLEVFIDGVAAPSDTTEPFEFVWDTSTVPPGSHNLIFKTTDEVNNSGETSLSLIVQPAVTVEITNPSEGETISEATLITADAAAPFSRVVKVDFLVDGNLLRTVMDPPYEAQWDLSGVSAGAHVIKAIAAEENGAKAEAEANVSVSLRGLGTLWLAGLAVLAVAAVLIPLAFRGRRKMRRAEAAPEVIPAGAGVSAPTLRSGQGFLSELNGLNPGQIHPLTDADVRLGRKRDENDIPLKGTTASRWQAVIRVYQGHYILYNLSPENPILVNDLTVNQQQVLKPNDILRAGESEFRFEVQG